MKMIKKTATVLFVLAIALGNIKCFSQDFMKERKVFLNPDGTNYIKVTLLTQAWLRNQEYNPGSTVFGFSKESGTDIGIRRFRAQFYGQLTDRVFVYSQIGQNNFNSISDRKQGFFIHDACGDYSVVKKHFYLGMGLSGWSGLSRFSSPAAGSILGVDAPLFLQSTNDVTDQFLRKLSVYVKGKIGKLDYRLALAQPMAIQKSQNYNPTISRIASFSSRPPKLQWNGYFQYQLKDQESNTMPYATGTYLGKKKIFNIGAGFVYQKDAMWKSGALKDTIQSNMAHFSVDFFYDAPIGAKGQSVSVYSTLVHCDYGANYTRNLAVMNPANGNNNLSILNGSGNGFPAYGTGTVFYTQIGFKFKNNLLGKTTFMPYASLQHANYERLNSPMDYYDVGVNWLLSEHVSKFTLAYQNRPVYNNLGDQIDRKGAFIAQYQFFFN
jgi:hypothetical protein